eukprot:CAMPEP_0179475864 /NCGR_PEP_ID=MMETSP0799-20121207/54972_1 /TAXON_ID=46947 /ORGANISM="Geminigera cryophila, Strain CCMP2564" /LENGTH=112 /DNA_ID=CAMNT_0021285657 /DNA_START=91 /DNA_END=429 /DNA_ORIENTATION=-
MDNSARLDRVELSEGLIKVGIFLKPSEMRVMLEVLDVDKSDDVSLQELTDFWMYAPPLRLGDEAQALYWNKRGFRGRVYEELEHFYDIRSHYPRNVIEEYNVQSPCALTPWM